MRFSLSSLFLFAALVFAGCDSQGPDAGTQPPATQLLPTDATTDTTQETAVAGTQNASMFPGEIVINSSETVTIRDVVGPSLLSPKLCPANLTTVYIETDGDFPSSPCSLRFVNNRSSALIYFPDTKRPLQYVLTQYPDDENADIILDHEVGLFSIVQGTTSPRVEVSFLTESLNFGLASTFVRPNGRPYIDAPWSKTFNGIDLDHGLVRTQYRRKGTTVWKTAKDNVAATSGVIRITPALGDDTFQFRVLSLLTGESVITEHVFDDPRVANQQGTVSIVGPFTVDLNELNTWEAGVTAPSGASESSRTWSLRDGNASVSTSTAEYFSYEFTSPPTSQVGYFLTLDVTFSDGSTASDLFGISIGGGPGGGGGNGCPKGEIDCA